jgi:hypothetical protein
MPLSNMHASTFLIPIGLPSLVIAQTYVLQDNYGRRPFSICSISSRWATLAVIQPFLLMISQSADPTNWVCIVCGPGNRAERGLDRYQQRIHLHGRR